MLFNRRKAEIEILSTINDSFEDDASEHEGSKEQVIDITMVANDETERSSAADMPLMQMTIEEDNEGSQHRQERDAVRQSHEGFGMPIFSMQTPS